MPSLRTSTRLRSKRLVRSVGPGLLALAMACLPMSSRALDPELRLDQFQHSVWTARDGVPANIGVIEPGADGTLWIGAGSRLWRFDGIAFEKAASDRPERFESALQIFCLHEARDGALWIGWEHGGVTRLKDGVVTDYRDGLEIATLWAFAETAQGELWVAGLDGVARFDGTHWHKMGAAEGFPGLQGAALLVGPDGVLNAWDETGARHRWNPARGRFEGAGGGVTLRLPPAMTPDGMAWVYEPRGVRAVANLAQAATPRPTLLYKSAAGEISGTLTADRDGGLWFDGPESLHRAARPATLAGAVKPGPTAGVETFAKAQGLSGRFVYTIREDREGDIWVVTEGGLDRFRRSRFVGVPIKDIGDPWLTAAADGAIWVNAPDESKLLLKVGPHGEAGPAINVGDARVVAADHEGTLWVAGGQGIGPLHDGRIGWMPMPGDLGPDVMPMALGRQRDGTVLLSVSREGVFVHDGGAWHRETTLSGNGRQGAMALLVDTEDRAWLGFENRIARRAGGRFSLFGPAEGVQAGIVTAFAEAHGELFAGAERGLLRLSGSRFVPVPTADPEVAHGVVGLAETPDGALWINSVGAGLARIGPAELATAREHADHAVHARVFGPRDGVLGGASMGNRGSLAVDGQGRLWIGTRGGGLAWTWPTAPTPAAPATALTGLTAGGRNVLPGAAGRPIELPLGARDVRAGYRAMTLSAPEGTRFRVRLRGYDRDWQDGQTRREASYTGLRPGDYRFEVQAAGDDGAWSGSPAQVAFRVPPYFHETWPFRALVAVLAMLGIWGLHRLRLQQERRRLMALAQAQLDERERIARELHDTVLQSTQGLIMGIQGAVAEMDRDSTVRRRIERTLDAADRLIGEGRDNIQQLRLPDLAAIGFDTALGKTGQELADALGVPFRLVRSGSRRALLPEAGYQAFAIAREALRNAYEHAQAAAVEARVIHERAAFRVEIRDDGVGLPAGLAAAGGVEGHWGLPGMRERAHKLGATLDVTSAPGAGTTVSLVVPGEIAYADATGVRGVRGWWARRRRPGAP